MRKIMIIDDNYLSVEGICTNIDSKTLNVQVTHKAYDPITAINILKNEHIDLIISDIEMPQINGLELSKKALSIQPSVKIILISAFDKFEYAKQAIRLGAYDYIEKPIDYKYLNNMIKSALAQIEKKEKDLEILKKSRPALIENFFWYLMNSNIYDSKFHLDNYSKYLNLNFNYNYFITVIAKINNAMKIENENSVQEYHILFMNLHDDLKNLCKDFDFFYTLNQLDNLIIIIGHNCSSEKYIHQQITETFSSFLSQYQNKLLEINIGIGQIIKHIYELQVSYKTAYRALEYRFFFPQKNFFDICDNPKNHISKYIFYDNKEEELIQLLCKKDLDKIKLWIHDFSKELLLNSNVKNLVFTQVYSILGRILKFLYEMNIDIENIGNDITFAYSHLETFNTRDDVFAWLFNLCKSICYKLDSSMKTYHKQLCDIVVNYVKENYSNKSLCLNDIAKHVNVSPAYLSALYKKNTGKNISDLIISTRIEVACHLLLHTKISLKEISEKTGYTNQYYFSSCFKKKIGKTPSIYREEN